MMATSFLFCFSKFDVVPEMTHILLAILIEVIAILVAQFDLVEVVLYTFLCKLTV